MISQSSNFLLNILEFKIYLSKSHLNTNNVNIDDQIIYLEH